MASTATIEARKKLGREWLDSSDAARELGTTPKALSTSIGHLLTRQSRSLAGRGARGVGYAYAKHDIQRVNAIKLALGVNTVEAARMLHGIRTLGHKGMLADIEKQLDLALDRQRNRERMRRARDE